MPRRTGLIALLTASLCWLSSSRAQEAPRYAGPTKTGFLLPNGWTVSPAGDQVAVADLPLNILPLADNRHVLVATSGYNAHELSLIDLEKKGRRSPGGPRELVRPGRLAPADRIWWSGGGANVVHRFELDGPKLTRKATEPKGEGRGSALRGQEPLPQRAGPRLQAQGRSTRSTSTPEPSRRSISRPRRSSSRPRPAAGPTTSSLARNGSLLYVSDWAGRAVRVVDPDDLRDRRPDRRRRAPQPDRRPPQGRPALRRLRLEQQRLGHRHPARDRHRDDPHGPLPAGPGGQHARRPGHRARRQDALRRQRRQQLRRRDRHRHARAAARSRASFPPAGIRPPWRSRPTARHLLVGVGKGNQTKANPIDADKPKTQDRDTTQPPGGGSCPFPYIGTTLSGALSIVPIPDDKTAGRLHRDGLHAIVPTPTSCSPTPRTPRRRPSPPGSATRRRSST